MIAMNLAGVFAPIPTPFDEQDRVDTARLRAALARWIARPLTGFVVLGSNGEAVLMDDVESDRVIVAAREAVPRDRGFIVGTGRESTQAAIRATKRAAEHGADAVLVRTPGFFKTPDDDRRVRPALHGGRRRVAGAGAALQLHRGHRRQPAAGGRGPRSPTHPNIVGMKESGGDVAQIADLVAATPDDFQRARRHRVDVLCGAVRRRGRRHPRARSCAAGRVRAPVRARARRAATTRRGRCSVSSCRSRGCSAPPTACRD